MLEEAEPCPAYFDDALKVHWGLPDPAAPGGPQADVEAVFDKTVMSLERRIGEFLSLPLPHLSPQELSGALEAIGRR